MSIETQQKQGEKVREDLNRYRLKQDGQDGQDGQDEGAIAGAREAMQENLHRVGIGVTAPALQKNVSPGPVARGPVPRKAPQPLRILRSSRTLASRSC